MLLSSCWPNLSVGSLPYLLRALDITFGLVDILTMCPTPLALMAVNPPISYCWELLSPELSSGSIFVFEGAECFLTSPTASCGLKLEMIPDYLIEPLLLAMSVSVVLSILALPSRPQHFVVFFAAAAPDSISSASFFRFSFFNSLTL